MKYSAHENFSRDEPVSIGSEAIISFVKCGNHTDTDNRGVTAGELLALGITHDEAQTTAAGSGGRSIHRQLTTWTGRVAQSA
jgi:hypothetical protein